MEALLAFDRAVSLYMAQHLRPEWLNPVMIVVSLVGNAGLIWFLFALFMLCKPKYRRGGLALVCAMVAGFLLGNIFLQNLVMRPRPCWEFPEVAMLVAVPHDYSFPSGHTLAAFTAASVIFCVNRRAGAAAFLFAALMGFSRLYLFVHYTTDILAGAALGCLVGFLTVFIFYKTGNWPARESRAEGQKPHGG